MEWLIAAGIVALCTAVAAVMEPLFDDANLLLVYMAGVVYVALRCRRATAAGALIASILVYDFVYVAPRWSFKPTDPQYYFTFGVMLAVGLLVSHLAQMARRQTELARTRAAHAQALYRLAAALAETPSEDGIARVVEAAAASLGLHASLQRTGEADAPGKTVQPGALRFALPGANGLLGELAAWPSSGADAIPVDRQELLGAFANQAALALERSTYRRQTAQAAVDAETERLRSTLLSSISHDFRTPLTTILGSATSLLEQGVSLEDRQRKELLEGVIAEARRMHALTSNLLDLTRMEQGGVTPRCEWCPGDELVDEAVRVMGPRLDAHPLDVDAAPDAIVWCDPRLVGQALVNLLDNAVRYTPAGTRVRVSIEPGGEWWTLAVADSGPGLPPGREGDVLKKFFRGPGARPGAGSGLGLAICAAVAQMHGGTIEGANRAGACFILRLPQPPMRPPMGEGV
jgi:two-component system sensor histidine kinase KdpD